jgi:hypothetical protein
LTWTEERAEEHLLSLELFGMRFGLERMRRLLTALGSPQERFAAVHVVGTNGKSSISPAPPSGPPSSGPRLPPPRSTARSRAASASPSSSC